MRLYSMRKLLAALTAFLLLAICQSAYAGPADLLTQAKSEIAAGRIFAGDALLQQVVDSPDANSAQVEEAVMIQCLLYSGDVLGAAAMIGPLSSASPEGSGLKTLVSQQLLLARRAFASAGNSYLNSTIKGTSLNSVQLTLPKLTTEEVSQLLATLHNADVLKKMMQEFDTEPSAGHGLLAKVNTYSLYLAAGAAFKLGESTGVEQIGGSCRGGLKLNELQFLDWAARTALDMNMMVREPNGPDLAALAQRFDQRIVMLAGGDETNAYVVNARKRAKIYER